MRRLRRLAVTAALALTAIVVLAAFATRTAVVRSFVRARLEAAAGDALGAQVRIRRLGGSLLRTLVLDDVRLSVGGKAVARIGRLDVAWIPEALLRGRIRIDRLVITAPWLRLAREGDGWRLPAPAAPRDPMDGQEAAGLALDVARLRIRGGRLEVESPNGRLAAADLQLDAAIRHGPRGSRADVHALSFTPRGVAVTPVTVAGSVTATPDGTLAAPDVRLATARTRIGLVGRALPGAHVDATLTLGPLSGREVRALVPASGLRTDLEGTVSARGPWDGIALALGLDLGAGGQVALTGALDLRSDPPAHHAVVRVARLDPGAVISGQPRTRLDAVVVTRGRGLDDSAGRHRARARAAAPMGAATASARIGFGRLAGRDAEADVTIFRLEDLLPGLGGRGNVHVRLADERLRFDAEAKGPALDARAAGQVDLAARTTDATLSGTLDLAGVGESLDGRVAVEATVSGDLDAPRIGATVRAEPLRWANVVAERGRVTFTVDDATSEPLEGTLEAASLDLGEKGAWRLAQPARFVTGDVFSSPGIVLVSGDQRITLAGQLGAAGCDASLTLTSVQVAPLCSAAGVETCGGRLSGRAALRGGATAPRLDADVALDALTVRDVAYGRLEVSVHHAARSMRVDATLRHAEAGTAQLVGTVPLDLSWAGGPRDMSGEPVDLALTATGLDLRFLSTFVPDDLRETAGRLDVDLRADGPRRAPRLTGTIGLDAGRLELLAAGVPYEDVRLRLDVDGDVVVVRELRAHAGGGTLEGTGRFAVDASGGHAMDVTLRLDDFFALRRQAFETAVSGALSATGSLGAPVIVGKLDVVRGLVRPAAFSEVGPTLDPDSTITVVGRDEEETFDPPAPPPGFLDALHLDLEVALARNVWIRRSDANIELGGTLSIQQLPWKPLLLQGDIRLLRGWYAFQGRRFEIARGTIAFTGATPADPTLDIQANHRARGYIVRVRVEGTAAEPRLTLSSEPPLEEADVLAVLLFGKPVSELGSGESASLQQSALGLASGYVMPELRASVQETLGLDTLDVQMPAGEEAGRVSAGRYVTRDVLVSLAQEFGAHGGQAMSVEYGLTRSLSLRGSTSTRGNSTIDLLWSRRY